MFDKKAIWRWLAAAMVLTPPAALGFLIWKYSVNVPLWDQWESDISGIFWKYSAGPLTFGDLLAQHNEARLFFPRILFLVLGELTHWNVRFEMAATFLTACLIFAMVYRLGRPAFDKKPAMHLVMILLSSMLIFSPAMYEAWLWGLEIICYIPLACIMAALLLSGTKIGRGPQVAGCALLAAISTYSFGNGFLAWIVLFPALFCEKGWKDLRARKREIGLWLAGFATSEIFYFYGYQQPSQLRPLSELAKSCVNQPARTAKFFLAFFGAPLVIEAGDPLPYAVGVGAILMVLSLIVVVCMFRLRADSSLRSQAGPWLAIGAYSVLSGGLATVARSAQFGVNEAMSSRYGLFAVSLIVALVHLVPLVTFGVLARRRASTGTVRYVRSGLGLMAAILAVMQCLVFPAGVWDMRSTWQYRVMGKSWLAFIHIIPEQKVITELLYPKFDELKQTATTLQKLGLLQPPPFTEYPTNLFRNAAPAATQPLGRLESARSAGRGFILFSGWAVAPSRAREADAVVLTWERPGGEPRPFTLMDDRVQRPDFETLGGEEPYLYAGWQSVCSVTNLPRESVTVKAWGYDSERQTVWPLDGTEEVDNR